MIDARIIQALVHADPAIRKKAIVALGKSQDKEALPHLAKVYKNDADPEVRDYALKAGRYIQSQSATKTVPAQKPVEKVVSPPQEPEPIQQEAPPPDKPKKPREHKPRTSLAPAPAPVKNVYISQDLIEKAEQKLELAYECLRVGDELAAEKLLRKAFDINPNLINDEYVCKMAHFLIGRATVEESVQTLLKLNYSAHIVYSTHARERMELRKVNEEQIISTIEEFDDTLLEDDGDTRFIKSIKRFDGQMRNLNVIAKPLETKSRTRDKWLIKTTYVRGEEDDGYIKPTYRGKENGNYNKSTYRNKNKNNSYSRWDKKRHYPKQEEKDNSMDVISSIALLIFIGMVVLLYLTR